MTTIELKDLPLALVQHLLQSPDAPIRILLEGRRLMEIQVGILEDEAPIDLTRSPRLREILEDARRDHWEHGGVPLADVKAILAEEQPATSTED